MSLKVTKADVWAGEIRDVPGGLAEALETLSQGGGSLQFLIARRNDKETGTGKVFLTPVSGKKSTDAANRAGLARAGMGTLRVEGADRRGLGGKIARAIADAGVNVRGVSAAVIGSKFVAYIGLDSDADATTAAKALKTVNAGGSKAKKSASKRRG